MKVFQQPYDDRSPQNRESPIEYSPTAYWEDSLFFFIVAPHFQAGNKENSISPVKDKT